MAEHPGVMGPGEFDLVGFAVGAAERGSLITGQAVSPGDVLIGLPSPNLRSNGFSLARRVMFDVAARALDDPAWDGAATTVADELLAPSVIYAPAVIDVVRAGEVHAVAHVTGGGLAGNLGRVLAAGVDAVVDTSTWESPRIFDEIQRLGNVDTDEMRRVFNCGIGMVLAVPEARSTQAIEILAGHGHRAVTIGEVVPGSGKVQLR
jgi:phosphoribosylformylglycinamidine cyclo-ligase